MNRIKGILLCETLNSGYTEVTTQKLNLSESATQVPISADSIMVDIEGIHSNIITRNDTLYTPECLKKSVPFWTNPYQVPLIFQHKEKDLLPIGRIKAVEYVTSGTRSQTPALVFTTNVAEDVGVKGVQNGNLVTPSISAIGLDVRCSICNQNLAEEGMCEHEKGVTYGKDLCYWVIHEMEPKELSYVTVPSDKYAHNLRVYKPETVKKELKENCEVNGGVDLLSILQEQFPVNKPEVTENVEGDVVELTEGKEEEKKPEVKEEPKAKEEVELNEEGDKGDETKAPKEDEAKAEEKEVEAKEEEPKEEEKEESKEDEAKAEEEEPTLEDLKKEIEDLKVEIDKLKASVKIEKELKESLENELETFKTAKKMEVVENVVAMRKELKLEEMSKDTLMEYTSDTLEVMVKSLTECRAVTSQLKPASLKAEVNVSEAADNTTKEVKKETKKVNVKESADDILYKIMNSIM